MTFRTLFSHCHIHLLELLDVTTRGHVDWRIKSAAGASLVFQRVPSRTLGQVASIYDRQMSGETECRIHIRPQSCTVRRFELDRGETVVRGITTGVPAITPCWLRRLARLCLATGSSAQSRTMHDQQAFETSPTELPSLVVSAKSPHSSARLEPPSHRWLLLRTYVRTRDVPVHGRLNVLWPVMTAAACRGARR